MTTNTTYGTWLNATGTLNVASYIVEAFDSEGPDGFDTEAIERDFRDAINDALPAGVTLAGDEFYGPVWSVYASRPSNPQQKTLTGVDLSAAVESVDFWAIVAKHHHGA